jgi:hypothetical protein
MKQRHYLWGPKAIDSMDKKFGKEKRRKGKWTNLW